MHREARGEFLVMHRIRAKDERGQSEMLQDILFDILFAILNYVIYIPVLILIYIGVRNSNKIADKVEKENQEKILAKKAKIVEPFKKDQIDYIDISNRTSNAEKYYHMSLIRSRNLRELSMMTIQLGTSYAMSAHQEKERSWGLAGGIAQGLAGPAAGVAAAIDVMNENQRIRERNAENQRQANQTRDEFYDLAERMFEDSLSSATLKGSMNHTVLDDPRVVFDDICFTSKKAQYKIDLNLVEVNVEYTLNNCKPNWTVDGSLRAEVYDKYNMLVGSALMPLHYYFDENYDPCGSNQITKARGILCDIQSPGPYSVKIQPHYLWRSCSAHLEKPNNIIPKERYKEIIQIMDDEYKAKFKTTILPKI